MRDYLKRANVHITFLRYFENERKRTASAQMNVDADDEHIIKDTFFWPEGIMMRPWVSREVFYSEHRRG